MHQLSSEWQEHFDQLQVNNGRFRSDTAYELPTTSSHGPGRPKFAIEKEQLEYLSSMSFSWVQIAQILGVSRMTIYRRRVEFGLLIDPSTSIADSDLKSIIISLRNEFPEIGESIAWGHLRSMKIRVSRERVRYALRESDPLTSALRWRGILTKRRPYSVPGPNSLWHIGKHNYYRISPISK